jgi:hypothetical protein
VDNRGDDFITTFLGGLVLVAVLFAFVAWVF